MRIHCRTARDFERAMQAVRIMDIDRNREPRSPACRLAITPGTGTLEILRAQEDATLRIRVPIQADGIETAETTLSSRAVETLCRAPTADPLTLEIDGKQLRATIGRAERKTTFDGNGIGHNAEHCRAIMDDERRETSAEIDAGQAGERLHRIGRKTKTCRLSMGPDGIHATAVRSDSYERPGTMLSDAAATGDATSFRVNHELLTTALRALPTRRIKLEAGPVGTGGLKITTPTGEIALRTSP